MPSRKQDSQSSACEVTLVHYEDMGIPKDVAKLGVRHGMWGTVKKLHSGLRAYQKAREQEASTLSRCALMARATTKISCNEGTDPKEQELDEREQSELAAVDRKRDGGRIDWRLVAIGGAVAVFCGLRTGLIGRAVLIGAGHRIAGRRGNGRR